MIFASAFVLASCADFDMNDLFTPEHKRHSSSKYYWGNYQLILYKSLASDEGISPAEQVERLLGDIEKAQTKGKKPGPGINLHLAMLYANIGNVEAAERFILAEQDLFPMSTDFSSSVFGKIIQ